MKYVSFRSTLTIQSPDLLEGDTLHLEVLRPNEFVQALQVDYWSLTTVFFGVRSTDERKPHPWEGHSSIACLCNIARFSSSKSFAHGVMPMPCRYFTKVEGRNFFIAGGTYMYMYEQQIGYTT